METPFFGEEEDMLTREYAADVRRPKIARGAAIVGFWGGYGLTCVFEKMSSKLKIYFNDFER